MNGCLRRLGRRSQSLPRGVKVRALLVVVITFAVSIVLVDVLVVRIVLLITAVILATFLYRLPTARPAAAR